MGMASELARRLAGEAEAVCRAYLPNGRRSGRYWIVADVQGTPGRQPVRQVVGGSRLPLGQTRGPTPEVHARVCSSSPVW